MNTLIHVGTTNGGRSTRVRTGKEIEMMNKGKTKIKVCFDIDDTITADPEFFSFLSRSVKNEGGRVYVVTSRTSTPEVREETRKELAQYNIVYDDLYLLPDAQTAAKECPYAGFDWYQKYLYQKVTFCEFHKVDIYFDDDDKVIEIFRETAPQIQVFKVCKRKDEE